MARRATPVTKPAAISRPTIVYPAAERESEVKPAKVEPVSAEQIRLCAYFKWEGAGRPGGDGLHFWAEAERELRKAG